MKIPFRQGIVSAGTDASHTPNFVSVAPGGFVNFNATAHPVMLSFAYKYHGDYLVEIRKDLAHAWGPFTDVTQTYYLYWDISFVTGALTYGSTKLSPLYQSSVPVGPQVDQHWFNTDSKIMFVWNGTSWIEHLRVFAATLANAATLTPLATGTQAGLNQEVSSGFILYDDSNTPIRTSDGYFFTTETDASAHFSPSIAAIKIEQSVMVMEAVEPMAAFSLVAIAGQNQIYLANVGDATREAIGVVTSALASGESADVIFRGVITLPSWSNVLFNGASSWPIEAIGKPVYLGQFGQFTWVRPSDLKAQRIGVVLNTLSVYLTFDSETLPFPVQDGTTNLVGAAPIQVSNNGTAIEISITNATHTAAGAMSAADKVTLDSSAANLAAEIQHRIDGDFANVPKAGGTMTGPLILSGNPTSDLQAVPKQYVLDAISNNVANLDGGSF